MTDTCPTSKCLYAVERTLACTSLLLLAMGGMLYLLFRPRTLMMFGLADGMGLGGVVDGWRMAAQSLQLPAFVVYSLPGGLWSASYVLLTDALLRGQPRRIRLTGICVIPLIGAASELLQGFKLLPGTFDLADVACYLLPLAAYIILTKTF